MEINIDPEKWALLVEEQDKVEEEFWKRYAQLEKLADEEPDISVEEVIERLMRND